MILAKVFAAIIILLSGLFTAAKSATQISKLSQVSPSPAPTIVLSPTPTTTPTPIPTSVPTPKPIVTPKPTAIPVPALIGPPGTGLSTVTVSTSIGSFKATVLSIDMTTSKMITDIANDDNCPTNCAVLSLVNFVSRNSGYAGVNGTYFCPATYPECASKSNSFDFPVFNSRLHKWINGGNLGWAGRALIFADGSGIQYRQNSTQYPGSPDSAIINYPGLVDGGNVQIDDNQSGLSDKQKTVNTKVGIGTRNPNNIMVVVAYGVNMQQFAHVFKSLGATGALNLDTGGSAALYNSGRYVVGPGRDLPNALIFAKK